MSRFRGAWTSLNFDKEYLFGFETLVFVTSGISSMHKQLVTPQRERKLEITSYNPFKSQGREVGWFDSYKQKTIIIEPLNTSDNSFYFSFLGGTTVTAKVCCFSYDSSILRIFQI